MLLLAFVVASTAPVQPAPPIYGLDAAHPNVWNGTTYAPTPRSIGADKAHKDRLTSLRRDALALQASDGGTLTAEHRAELQQRLNDIELRYAEMRRRFDPSSVDANGHPVYSAYTRPRVVEPTSITPQPVSH